MVTRRGTRHSAAAPIPKCLHSGASGHIATICPRTTYTPTPPSLTCNHCIRTCRSGWSDEPEGHQMIVVVDPCQTHATPVVRPTIPLLAIPLLVQSDPILAREPSPCLEYKQSTNQSWTESTMENLLQQL